MPVRLNAATAFKLDTTGVEIVAELAGGENQIVGLAIGNVGDVKCRVSLHVVNVNQTTPLDDVDQFNAILGWYLRQLGPREEGVVITVPLGPGNKIVGITDPDDTAVIHAFPVNA